MVRFHITPQVSLIDSPVHIRLEGLQPRQTVLIRARRPSKVPGAAFESWGVFVSDRFGVVDVGIQRPLEGTYATEDGMGLFWSVQRIHSTQQSTAYAGPPFPLLFTFTAETDGNVIAEATVERKWLTPSVDRLPIRENGLVGTYFCHQDNHPRPGIIVLGGSEGGLNEATAALLASHGYATLALAYFGIEDLPRELVNIPLEYVERAIEWFLAQPGVHKEWLGVHGTSKGGELALLSATMFPQIKAVVCISSGGVALHGITSSGADKLPASWTYQGMAIPYASEDHPYRSGRLAQPTTNVIAYRPWYDAHISDETVLRRATMPVERIQGGILLISGQDDQMIDSERLSQISMERLNTHQHPYRFEHLVYPGAGHAIGIPYMFSNIRVEVPGVGRVWTMGGSPSGNACASEDSWRKTLAFFHQESGLKVLQTHSQL